MTITEQVENILKASKTARNSDKELQLIYMQKSGMDLDARQIQRFRDMPDLWTIRRIRQKLQEGGKYKADKRVEDSRKFKAMQGQQQAPKFTAKGLEQTLNGQVILPWGE
jgi:hypothetical protein